MAFLISPLGRWLAGAALALGAVVGAWLYVTGLQHDNATLKAAFATEQAAFRSEQAIARKSEGVRGLEHTAAVQDASDLGASCTARISAARQSATAISAILQKEPAHDANHCPVPDLVGAVQLRGATGLP